MEAFASIINIFLEKRLIPTVLGLITATIVYIVTPESNILLEKLGRGWYVLLYAGIFFLLISFIQYLYTEKKCFFFYINRKKLLKQVWTQVDAFNSFEKMFILEFINSNNRDKPVTDNEIENFEKLDIDTSKLFIRTYSVDENGESICVCKLNPDSYRILKYSKEKYGRICNFVEEYNI